MFIPSASSFVVRREQPEIDDIDAANKIVERRNYLIATKAVTEFLIKRSKRKGGSAIVKRAWAVEKNIERHSAFVGVFNYWRSFYFELNSEWTPKTSAQITCIENVIKIVEESEIDLSIFIACSFKEWEWCKKTPSLQMLQSKGMEYYEKHAETVLAELDERRYISDY